ESRAAAMQHVRTIVRVSPVGSRGLPKLVVPNREAYKSGKNLISLLRPTTVNGGMDAVDTTASGKRLNDLHATVFNARHQPGQGDISQTDDVTISRWLADASNVMSP